MAVTADVPREIGHPRGGGLRIDESAVRLVFVERSPDYADLVCETLENARNGRFEVRHADRLDIAAQDVEAGDLDAVLVDLTAGAGIDRNPTRFEDASILATRVPVIVLTGSEQAETDAPDLEVESAVLERIARSRLPAEILSAVRRHRRLGQHGAAEPIVLRDPLRACAQVFARIRRTLAQP